jgi:hypothetical protein
MTLKTVLVGYADDLRTLLLVCGEGRKLKGPENKNTLPVKKPGKNMPKSFSVSVKCGRRFYHSP